MSLWQHITLGQYVPGNSPLHRLDPRAKLISGVLVLTGLLAIESWTVLLAWSIALGTIAWFSDLRLDLLLRNLRGFFWLLALTMALHAFTADAAGPQVTLWGISISWRGAVTGALYALRLALFIWAAALATMTTTPTDFADSLERLLQPLVRVRVPVHELAFIMALALRFVPTIAQEALRIQRAQFSRGAPERGSLLHQLRQLVPMVVPLFIATFHRADDLALAMEARGYRGQAWRSRYREFQYAARDIWVIGGCGVAAFATWYFETFGAHAHL